MPRSALPAMFDEIARVEREHGIVIPTVAHAGDGNLHPNFVFDGHPGPDGTIEVPPAVWDAADDLFRSALRLGGTLTGEHGIGVLKRRWLADELGDDQWELQRQITRVFDPPGILNPGKVFTDWAPALHELDPTAACLQPLPGRFVRERVAVVVGVGETGCRRLVDHDGRVRVELDRRSGERCGERSLHGARDGIGFALAEREQHQVAGAEDRAESLRDAVPRHVVDRVEEAGVVCRASAR